MNWLTGVTNQILALAHMHMQKILLQYVDVL